MGTFNSFFGQSGNISIDKFSLNQKNNLKLLLKTSILHSLLTFNNSVSEKKTNIFYRYKRELESEMIPDSGLSIEDTLNKFSNILEKEELKYEILRNMSEGEKDDFFEHLFAFIFFDEDPIGNEIPNYIGEIFRKINPDKNDDEIRKLIAFLITKYSNSDIFSNKNNNKLIRSHNGNVIMKINYKDGPEDILDGEFQEYYESGKLKMEGFYKDNKWHGSIKEYNEDENLKLDATMVNGIEEKSLNFLYHSNGKLKQKSTEVKGLMHGLVKIYYENGNIALEQICVNGQETGKFTQYYESGNIKSEGEKVKGEYKGLMKVFWETGELMVELDYDKNLMKTYTKDGKLHTERKIDN